MEFIPAFASNCCDLREAGNARARFNHQIYLNEDATAFFNENTVALFEVLDYNVKMLKDQMNKLDHELFYRIGWGYLKLNGLARNHVGISKVQMYKYKFNPTLVNYKTIQMRYPNVPMVYYDFIWPKKVKYEAGWVYDDNDVEYGRGKVLRIWFDCPVI